MNREERVRLYGEKSVAEGEKPYTREDLDRDVDNSCDHGSSAIRVDRIAATIAEVARLKGLIKDAGERENLCPWCEGRDGVHYSKSTGASFDCPAFTPEGIVK